MIATPTTHPITIPAIFAGDKLLFLFFSIKLITKDSEANNFWLFKGMHFLWSKPESFKFTLSAHCWHPSLKSPENKTYSVFFNGDLLCGFGKSIDIGLLPRSPWSKGFW